MIGRYFLKILTVFDILGNVVLFNGNPHETISDRAAFARQLRLSRLGNCALD